MVICLIPPLPSATCSCAQGTTSASVIGPHSSLSCSSSLSMPTRSQCSSLSPYRPPPIPAVYTTILSATYRRPPPKSSPLAPLVPSSDVPHQPPTGHFLSFSFSLLFVWTIGKPVTLSTQCPSLSSPCIHQTTPAQSEPWETLINEKGILTLSRSSRRQSLRQGLHANT